MGEKLESWNAEAISCNAQEKQEAEVAESLTISQGNQARLHVGTAMAMALLKACAKQKDLHRGSRVHADVVRRGLLESNIHIGNTLVNMYAKCGALEKAREVFNKLPARNVASWNVLIAGYAHHGL
eukprot:c35530_g1_i1 orf=207-584(+)